MRSLFGFDSWHASAAFSCRPYKRAVVGIVNALHPTRVVEVGCGLGDIVSRVQAAERFGFDTDPAVIRAARFLHGRNARWVHGDAAQVSAVIAPRATIDCLIMVNWIHNVDPQVLASWIVPILSRVRYLLLDAVDADGPPSYRVRHDFEFLAGLARRVSVTRVAGEPRSFILFEVAS